MYNFKFGLGKGVKDIVTGYSGIVMCRVQYLTGCNQYGIGKTKLNKEGKREDLEYFDETRLVSYGKDVVIPEQKTEDNKIIRGCDENHPSYK